MRDMYDGLPGLLAYCGATRLNWRAFVTLHSMFLKVVFPSVPLGR